MNIEVKKTLFFLIILFASFAIVDRAFGKFAYNILIKMPQSSGEIAKMNYQIEYSEYDCYIFYFKGNESHEFFVCSHSGLFG